MKITSRGRYAVLAMVDLAKFGSQKPCSLSHVSVITETCDKLQGFCDPNLARSTIANTAYLPREVIFIYFPQLIFQAFQFYFLNQNYLFPIFQLQ